MTGSTNTPTEGPLTFEELALATRNRGMPLEALAYDLTPTGLHYLLIHFDIPHIDASAWRLNISGDVARPATLSLDQIRAMKRVEHVVTLECAGNGRARLSPRPVSQPWLYEAIGTARWSGTPLRDVLQAVGVDPGAVEAVFTGADRGIQGDVEHAYARSLPLDDAMRDEVLLAYKMNGEPLQPQHGYPLRLIVPGWYGMTSVKWLHSIQITSTPFEGYQQAVAYHYQRDEEDPGEPVSRIRARALMIPPGIPSFFSRERTVESGTVTLAGRAWCGLAPVRTVEVGVDDIWFPAQLDEPIGPFAWHAWRFEWEATPGAHTLWCRATDEAGSSQPTEQPWNYQGLGNNLVQEVQVTVR